MQKGAIYKISVGTQWVSALALLASPLAQADTTSPFNSGDTAWMLSSTALVLLMTVPGLALFYAGMVRKKNVLATAAQSFAITALIVGAFAELMKFSALLWFTGLWSLLVYAPIAHMVWGPGGWLAADGVLDYAGGTVVHINAGIAGLVAALVIGKRIGYRHDAMHPNTLIGASLLWVGWFGFNAGSAVAASDRAGMAMATTQIATAWRPSPGCLRNGWRAANRRCWA